MVMLRSARHRHRSRQGGFTLIELMTVIALIFILVGIALPRFKASIFHARKAACKEDLYRLQQAIDQYHADTGTYPESLDTLKEKGYIHELRPDPMTGEEWVVELEEEPEDPRSSPGVWVVKSASDCGEAAETQ
jgi:general secretion pathway protein G